MFFFHGSAISCRLFACPALKKSFRGCRLPAAFVTLSAIGATRKKFVCFSFALLTRLFRKNLQPASGFYVFCMNMQTEGWKMHDLSLFYAETTACPHLRRPLPARWQAVASTVAGCCHCLGNLLPVSGQPFAALQKACGAENGRAFLLEFLSVFLYRPVIQAGGSFSLQKNRLSAGGGGNTRFSARRKCKVSF